MTPAITAVRMSGAAHRAELPLLVLGPSLGSSASTLWSACAGGLTDAFDVLAWDLPGHGHNRAVPDEPFAMADLARGVLSVVDDVLAQRDQVGGTFLYAGDSAGGAVGLQLLLDAPARVGAAVLLAAGDGIGRAGPGEAAGEAHVRRALGDLDVRDRLGEIAVPVLAVAAGADAAIASISLEQIASGVRDGRLVVLDDVAHPVPVEAPDAVAALLREHFLGEAPGDRAAAPGLDRRSRSLIALTAAAVRGRDQEVATQVRAALRDGLGSEEIEELLALAASYREVP